MSPPRIPDLRIGDLGALGVVPLKRLWAGALAARSRTESLGHSERRFQHFVTDALGPGLEQVQQDLMQRAPSFAEFEQWIVATSGGVEAEQVARINAAAIGAANPEAIQRRVAFVDAMAPVLSTDDLAHWDRYGYVIVYDAVPEDSRHAAERAIWQHAGARPEDPDSWYVPNDHGIMVQLFQHLAFDENRRATRIPEAFAQLWGTADLWMTTDRVGFNAPERRGAMFRGPDLHWDASNSKSCFRTDPCLVASKEPSRCELAADWAAIEMEAWPE